MRPNHEKISRALIRGNILLFFPSSVHEAEFIQRRLFDLGCNWSGATSGQNQKTIANVEKCMARGMVVINDGKLYTAPGSASLADGLLCRSDQFDNPYLSPEQAFFLEQFNKLAKRLDAIEEQLKPQKLNKSDLKKPGT